MTCSFISRHTSSRTISKRLGGCWREEEADSNYSQHNGAAQYFHGIAAHADVANALAFPGCSDIHFTWATALDSLTNQHLLIALCYAVLDHPTGSATGRRACGWIFAAVKKHSRSSFKPAFAPFGTQKVEKVGAGILQKFRRLCIAELQIGQRLSISEWHNRERQSCRDRLYRPFRRNLVNGDSNHASDLLSGKRSSEFRIALAHFAEDLAVHSITPGILRICSEAHRNFPGFQVEADFGGLLWIGSRRIQIQRCTKCGMSGKGQLLLDREDADFLSVSHFGGTFARKNESRFRKIHLAR